VSFFDEDDEPVRTTQRTRARAAPRPRRGTPPGGRSPDAQTLLIRRMILFFAAALVVLVLGFIIKSCSNSRAETALREYNTKVSELAVKSRSTGDQFFRAMNQGASQSGQELYGQVVGWKNDADTTLTQAEALNVPDKMKGAQQSLLIALELRRDGLTKVAGSIKPALGDEGDAADQAIKDIAGDMNMFNASDVLYHQRVEPLIKERLKDLDGTPVVETSQFMKEISWVSPQFVASKLGQQLATGDQGAGKTNQPTGPGLHGTGLNATSYGDTTLQPTVSNRLTYVAGQAFTVSFTNQGDNDEFNIKVTLKIARQSGAPLTLNKTVPRAAKGEKITVTLPLNRPPPLETALTISVVVAAVPGEKKTDNNKASYPSLFVQG
jgi:archaellin